MARILALNVPVRSDNLSFWLLLLWSGKLLSHRGFPPGPVCVRVGASGEEQPLIRQAGTVAPFGSMSGELGSKVRLWGTVGGSARGSVKMGLSSL